MPPKFEIPRFEALREEQEVVQSGKCQERLISDYDGYMFPGQIWKTPLSDAVADFIRPYCKDSKVSLEGVLDGMYGDGSKGPVNWVDMGGGRGLAMRQLASRPSLKGRLAATNVDLFDLGLRGLTEEELDYLEGLSPGMTADDAEPDLIIADAEVAVLSEPADFITSIETIQYLNNPLSAIANWYNQLSDNGILIVSTEHDWASWIRYENQVATDRYTKTPSKDFLGDLVAAEVDFAATDEPDWDNGFRPKLDPNRFRTLAIKKKPGTHMKVNVEVQDVWVNPFDFKAVYYDRPEDERDGLIEIVQSQDVDKLAAWYI